LHAIQHIEQVPVKTASVIDNLNRYKTAVWRAVSVEMNRMCICCGAPAVRTIGL
jgi:hypothetical protein